LDRLDEDYLVRSVGWFHLTIKGTLNYPSVQLQKLPELPLGPFRIPYFDFNFCYSVILLVLSPSLDTMLKSNHLVFLIFAISFISIFFSRPAHFSKTISFVARFSPEALNWLFIKGLLGWFLQVALLKVTLLSLGSGEAPLLDIVAYAGYTFTGMCVAVLGKIIWGYSYYALMPWTCLCMGIFLVKTMKRVLFAEVRSYDSSKHHYLLLFIALAQFPLFTWLGNISVNWLI
jgi:hypothetical protein